MSEFPVDVAAFAARVSDPGATLNNGKFYSKDVSGVVHEFFQASDGTVYQLSPLVPTAGAVPYSSLIQALVVGTSNTIPNSTAVTSIFDPANDTFNLAANTKYLMRGLLLLDRTVGSTSSFLSLSFGGTAAPACSYTAWTWYGTVYPFTTSPAVAMSSTTAATALTVAITNIKRLTDIEGIITTTAAGTFIPRLDYSAAPGGVTTVLPGSYLELIPLGADTFTQQGGWTA